jgi:hypothetical protein
MAPFWRRLSCLLVGHDWRNLEWVDPVRLPKRCARCWKWKWV